ncbi:MAG: phage protease [Dysosmobacter welbionis]
MDPIVNSSTYNNHEGGQNTMDPKELAKLLGLPEDATEEQITQALTAALAELKKLKEDGKEPPPGSKETVANKAVCELLGLKSGAATSDVTARSWS